MRILAARARALGKFLLLPLLLAAPTPLLAANPELSARVQGVESEAAKSQALRIAKLDIAVRLHGGIAETVVTATFANPGDKVLEGDFSLRMPTGSVVTGYALDVNETMLDGVLVDQRAARIAYQKQVRAGIDPGLAEVGRDDLFRTRVYPIRAGSSRTIRLRFASPLDPVRGYVLPLDASADSFSLTAEASGMAAAPRIQLPAGLEARWRSEGGVHRLSVGATAEHRLDSELVVQPAERQSPLLVGRHPGGGRFFEISDSAPGPAGSLPQPQSVSILWDRSLSRADDDLAAEIDLVRRYLDAAHPERIELLLFASDGVERVPVASAAAAVERLRAVRYRGATSLAVLAGEQLPPTGICLVFTDGLVTIDAREGFQPACPLFAISTARDADRAWLGALARRSGGEAIDLASSGVEAALTHLTRPVPRVLDVRTPAGERIDYALLATTPGGWRIVGSMPDRGDLIVRIAGTADGAVERVYSPSDAAEPEFGGAGALWASDRLAVMAADDSEDRKATTAFARRWSVASPGISFLVLERAEDYAEARVAPPANFPEEGRREYERMAADRDREEARDKAERLQDVIGKWEDQKDWWAHRFDPNARPRRDKEGGRSGGVPEPIPAPPPPEPADVSAQGGFVSSAPVTVVDQAENALGDIVLSGGRISTPAPGASSTITVEPWSPDRPYLIALNAAARADLDRVFAEQQAKHGGLPAFWFDVAEWHRRKGRRAEAVTALLSALDLPTRNSETVALVAERLIRYGEVDRAIFLLERLASSEADRPQPRRSLALALARRAQTGDPDRRRADLARAISLLAEVALTPWDNGYDGIELIALMEANRLIPAYRKLGGKEVPLDPRLIALLDVDLRVVIEWNSEETDIDLWVDEPNRERAIYDNPRTVIGGRLSEDMTDGYGPEQYLVRRAPNGTFTVRANVFATDPLDPNGASVVTARLIRDYGRPTEQEEVVDIELLPGKAEGERLIGRIRFNR